MSKQPFPVHVRPMSMEDEQRRAIAAGWAQVRMRNLLAKVYGRPQKALYRVNGTLSLHDVKIEDSETTVPLPPKLREILRQHQRTQLQDTEAAAANTLGLVFTSTKGTPLEPRNVNRAFTALVKRAGLRPIRLHDLRHSCATLLFAQGADIATVQRILRHASITTTTRFYLEVIEKVLWEAIAGMDGLFGGEA